MNVFVSLEVLKIDRSLENLFLFQHPDKIKSEKEYIYLQTFVRSHLIRSW